MRSLGVDALLAAGLAASWATSGALSTGAAGAAALAWPVLLLATGHYRRGALGESRAGRVRAILGAGVRGSILALAASPFLTTIDLVPLAQLVVAFAVASGVHHLVDVRRSRPRLVLAGEDSDVRAAVAELDAAGIHEVVAVCLTPGSRNTSNELPAYDGLESAVRAADEHQADALVVLPSARPTPVEMRRLHWALAGIGAELCVGTGLLDVGPQRTRVLSGAGLDVLHVSGPVLDGPRRLLKDVLERWAALVAIVLALPLLAALALAIRLETPGAALFRQQRIGRDGVPFTMLKLRSMGVDAEAQRIALNGSNEKDAVLFKIQLDPRVTPIGRVLRKYSLDELPQLWNVVRGDMSLVGPRPALPGEVARYDVDPHRRLVVKPGVTGLWQVSGRSDLSWEESVRLDLRYVDNWSLGLDLSILVRTVRAVLGHRGAY
ncbi:exopolysaccharide biosynthesis polyprenyl glycosylphosphotransferase [Nocardioides sp. S5]|uniref:exopolysaccharide biosynthesis polyprenyl glycosylphosphotransferase n=1 Tax=Nocardioides sp. S5 TaxID=2017486 RepID=UPI001A8C08F5|nr:exopolysaccharide biosynthesis polyprenyl glycosylphosphotransferase [Nocardioides sp. S5]